MAIQVREGLVIGSRTRARIDEESNVQRAYKPHDIRSAIPLYDPTNPAKFPPYVFREYPKMPLLDGNKPIFIDEQGTVLQFYNEEDEAEFMEANPEVAEEIERNAPAKVASERLAAAEDEIAELRRKLEEAGIDPGNPRRKVSGVGIASAVRAAPAEDEDGSLAKQVQDGEAQAGKVNGNPLKKKK